MNARAKKSPVLYRTIRDAERIIRTMPDLPRNTPDVSDSPLNERALMEFYDLVWQFGLEDEAAGIYYSTKAEGADVAASRPHGESSYHDNGDDLPAAERLSEMKRMARETRAIGRRQIRRTRAERDVDGGLHK